MKALFKIILITIVITPCLVINGGTNFSSRGTLPLVKKPMAVDFSLRGEQNKEEYILIGIDQADPTFTKPGTLKPLRSFRIPGDIDPESPRHPKNISFQYKIIPPSGGRGKWCAHYYITNTLGAGDYGGEKLSGCRRYDVFPPKKLKVPLNIEGLNYYIVPIRRIDGNIQSMHFVFSDSLKKIKQLQLVVADDHANFGWARDDFMIPPFTFDISEEE